MGRVGSRRLTSLALSIGSHHTFLGNTRLLSHQTRNGTRLVEGLVRGCPERYTRRTTSGLRGLKLVGSNRFTSVLTRRLCARHGCNIDHIGRRLLEHKVSQTLTRRTTRELSGSSLGHVVLLLRAGCEGGLKSRGNVVHAGGSLLHLNCSCSSVHTTFRDVRGRSF